MPPLRGLVLSRNRRAIPYSVTDIKKWIRLNSSVFKVEKIDVMVDRDTLPHVHELTTFATNENVRLSLRISELDTLEGLRELAALGLHDIFLTPRATELTRLSECIGICKAAGLSARVQITAPVSCQPDPEHLAKQLADAVSVNVTLADAFTDAQPRRNARECLETCAWMNRLVRALDSQGIEANLIGLPYCHVDEANYPHVISRHQFFLDHQQYTEGAYTLAEKIFQCGPKRMSKAIESLLARRNSLHNALDRAVLPWLLQHPRVYVWVWMFHKFTRHIRLPNSLKPLPENTSACEAALEQLRAKQQRDLGPECSRCRFQRICDRRSEPFKTVLPHSVVKAQPGTPVVSPLHLSVNRTRYYDAVDEARRRLPDYLVALAETTRDRIIHTAPTREILPETYEIENHYNPQDDSVQRWFSFTNTELLSTVLTRIEPPFTLALTFGGGIADLIGFSFGRHTKIVCPMIDYSHKMALHVDKDGYYVLLRDGIPVRPIEFDGGPRLPLRLSGVLEPRISIHNIDGFIITQTLMLWEGEPAPVKRAEQVAYSVIIVSTRYTRRLQAALLSLAHQKGIDPARMEVVIAYVPGIDATDDLIESMSYTHPHLRIVRSSFSEDHVRSKGFMINESLHVASGEWIILMDSDIVLPPYLFERIEAAKLGKHFIAPDGRKMATPEMTAKILLGETRPWEDFEAVSDATTDYRYREAESMPCGFFQCVRREILQRFPYHELDHFEASDWIFAQEVIYRYGQETRLDGVAVLHLDHGGRQWYGTARHR